MNYLNVTKDILAITATGDQSKPWLIAICMVVSIVVLIGLIILGVKGKKDNKDHE